MKNNIKFTKHAKERCKQQTIFIGELVEKILRFNLPIALTPTKWTLNDGTQVVYVDEGDKRKIVTVIGMQKRQNRANYYLSKGGAIY